MPSWLVKRWFSCSVIAVLILLAISAVPAGAADSAPKRFKARTLATKHVAAKLGGRVRAHNGVELRVPPGVMRRNGKVAIRQIASRRYDVHIYTPWRGRVTVFLPLRSKRSLSTAHQTRKGWVIVRGKRVGKRLRLRVRSLSPFDTNEIMRYAIETVQLPYEKFLERKQDFTDHGCNAQHPTRRGCEKPYPYNRFNWTDDGCSPGWVPKWTYRNLFDGPCKLHDFGYRNFGNGLALGRDENTRNWIDRRFYSEMVRVCGKFSSPLQVANKAACLYEATLVFGAVRNLGRSAFYKPIPFPEPADPGRPVAQPVAPLPQAPDGQYSPATPISPGGSTAPARRAIVVDNRVTNGMSMREDSSPTRLLTQPWVFCTSRGCNINGTERGSGGVYDAAVCQREGERTTNGNDHDASDDANPARFESTRYYGVRLGDGTFGYVSEVWIRSDFRGGLGLPSC